MQQINAKSERRGYDGVIRTWREMEVMFKVSFGQDILVNLRGLLSRETNEPNPNEKKIELLEWCIENTPHWMDALPEELMQVTKVVDDNYADVIKEKKFNKALRDAYGYKHEKIVEISNWLNVKTCPYCNMQYTLFIAGHTKKSKMAKYQFDHFYPQCIYPMLSMSFYNLIPSCASCNQGKSSKKNLSLDFHPYQSAIKDAFVFRVTNPVPLMEAQNVEVEKIEMKSLVNENDKKEFEKAFHVEALYQHHKDVAKEVFLRAYLDSYYSYRKNFMFLSDRRLAKRMLIGFYPNDEEIGLRPLTKMQQDLWAQAKGVKRNRKK